MTQIQCRDVAIFGSGGLGREVLWTLRDSETRVVDKNGTRYIPNILGFIDDNAEKHGGTVNDATVLGGSGWLSSHSDVLTVVAVGIPKIREQVVAKLRSAGATFATVVSARAVVGDESSVGEGTIILPGAVITADVELGDFVLINPTASVSHDCVVGDFCSLGPGVSLAGNVHVGACCDIGTNASVIPGKQIGARTIVGAGACVTRNLPGAVTAVGVPAAVTGSSDSRR